MLSSSGCNAYDESFEPVANVEEVASYERELQEEQEEQQMLFDRFSENVSLSEWCSCGTCNTENLVKQEECFYCQDIDRCIQKMENFNSEITCITQHSGFPTVCLDRDVLEAASIGLRTSKGRSYSVLRRQRQTADAHFLRSVVYRQFFRFVWEFQGISKRLPLPCCVYHRIRSAFPSEDGTYCGFIEEDTVGGEDLDTDSETNSDNDEDQE